MRKIWMVLSAVVLASVLAVPALGGPILFSNTGVGAAAPGLVDPNWVAQPYGGPFPMYETMGSPTTYPFPYWLLNDGVSQWISPQPSYTPTGPGDQAIDWTFQTTFSLAGMVPSTAQISGRWLTDNQGIDIYLNGIPLGLTTPLNTFGGPWSLFAIPQGSPFVAGSNTLDFIVRNSVGATGNPVGLRVELSGTANDVPEPATLGLLGAGMLCLGIISRRKKRA